VISSDLGLVGVQNAASLGCRKSTSPFGDDGLLQHSVLDASVPGCHTDPPYPSFLQYRSDINTPMQVATDFGCIASLGTSGCGFEQQLEATLKALWPTRDARGMPNSAPPGGPFLMDTSTGVPIGSQGHGDLENSGFLRNDPLSGLSLIAIVLVTDEEDCSSHNTAHFTPTADVPDGNPLKSQDLNLRCFYNGANLYPIERYSQGFKALRPGSENLVIFAGIVGVPPDLVNPAAVQGVDFTNAMQRDAFYDRILNDARMTETIDPNMTREGERNLTPSCTTATGIAYPPRRIVNVAKQFGENAIIQSICQSDFGPALDAIITVIARQLGAVCLPRKLVRNSDGKVGCNVVWELPPPTAVTGPGIPTACGAPGWEFLLEPSADRPRTNDRGGAICTVAQLAVTGTGMNKRAEPTMTDGVLYDKGWYYDDFSATVATECTGTSNQRIAFSMDAPPPNGVTVSLECLNETQTLTSTRTDLSPVVEQPAVGDPCAERILNGKMVSGDAACTGTLLNGMSDTSMFCHPALNVCVLKCNTTADCPAAWVCDDRPDTVAASGGQRKICVNPTCGDLK
jgi:hypothetical protein